MGYTTHITVTAAFDDAVETTIDALAEEGFGVLCDIDVQATFEKKLDESFRQYRILGACNPALAYEGLNEELALGSLLPCNLVVYEADDGDVTVRAVDPVQLVGLTGNSELQHIGADVSDRYDRVLEHVSETLGTESDAAE